MTKFMKGMEKVWKILETTNEECPQCNEMTLRDDKELPDCFNCGYIREDDEE